MRFVVSAIGMNSSGATVPNRRLSQRSRASKLVTKPVTRLDDRLILDDQFAAVDRAVELLVELDATPRVCLERVVEQRDADVVGSLAWCRAMSARRRRSVDVIGSSPSTVAIPMLTVSGMQVAANVDRIVEPARHLGRRSIRVLRPVEVVA